MLRPLLPCLLSAAAMAAVDPGEVFPSWASVRWITPAPATTTAFTLVDCWATWCQPCVRAIPELSDLAAEFQGRVTVIGLSGEAVADLTPFVQGQGAALGYPVAAADAATWQRMLGPDDGMPLLYLVDATGTTVWRGRPPEARRAVEMALAGTLNPATAKRLAELDETLQQVLMQGDGDMNAGLKVTAEILAIDPVHPTALPLRIALAMNAGKREVVEQTLAALPMDRLPVSMALELARGLVDNPNAGDRFPRQALALARHGVDAEPTNPDALVVLAAVWARVGRLDRAIEVQRRAVALSPSHQADLDGYLEASAVGRD